MLTLKNASIYDDALHRTMGLCSDKGSGGFSGGPLNHYLLLVLLIKIRSLLMNMPFDEKSTGDYFFLDDELNVKNLVYNEEMGERGEFTFSYRKNGCFCDKLDDMDDDAFDAESSCREGRENFMDSETELYQSPLWHAETYYFQDDYSLDHRTISGVPGSEEFLEELQSVEDCTCDWTKEKAGAVDSLVQWSNYAETGISSTVLSNENSLLVYIVESSAPQFVYDVIKNKTTALSPKEQEFMLLWDSELLPFNNRWGNITCSYNGKNAWIEAIGTCNQCENTPQNFSASMCFYYFQKLTEELYYLYGGDAEVI